MAGISQVPLLLRVVSSSVAAAYKAQTIIHQIMKGGSLGIIDKGVDDLQTEADRKTQLLVAGSLRHHFKNIVIIGEEDIEEQDNPDHSSIETSFDKDVLSKSCPEHLKSLTDDQVVVWIDPLDGTKEFTQGLLDHVTVLIGISVNGVATAGVIAQPYYNYSIPGSPLGRVMWAVIGMGAFGVVAGQAPASENIITMTRSHSDGVVSDAVKACEPTSILRVGGCGHKVLLVLEGKAHAYVFASKGCKKWDTCAPEAIMHACGGRLTDLRGNLYRYGKDVVRPNTGGVLATMKSHDWYIRQIPPHVLKKLPSQ